MSYSGAAAHPAPRGFADEFDRAAIAARARDENFPVAMRVLSPSQRHQLNAIYRFARLTDEIGDRPGDPADGTADRLAQLDELEHQLLRALEGRATEHFTHPIVGDLAETVREFSLPTEPFLRLIEANRVDQRKHRYATYRELLEYCELSANPIGELVLCVFDIATPRRLQWSNAVCSGLQLVEHWQDVAEDYAAGRLYIPQQDFETFDCSEADVAAGRATPAFRALLRFEAQRAQDLLDSGVPLIRSATGRARLALCGFVAGGRAAIDAIVRADYDVLQRDTRRRHRDLARRMFGLLVAPRRAQVPA